MEKLEKTVIKQFQKYDFIIDLYIKFCVKMLKTENPVKIRKHA